MNKLFIILLNVCFLLTLIGCQQKSTDIKDREESLTAKQLLQGIWVDAESETVTFKIKGDTVYYPDTTSMPAYFRIVDDTLMIGTKEAKYPIIKQAEQLFWFKSPNGDIVKLIKSTESSDSALFEHRKQAQTPIINNKVLKRDTIVSYDGERYHCYIAINPTRNKVTKSELTADGVQVENEYFDNLIHISIFKGATRIYSKNFVKQMYAQKVPAGFLSQAILSDMDYDKIDSQGFHFNATLCIPDAASCYMVSTTISQKGAVSMELLEY